MPDVKECPHCGYNVVVDEVSYGVGDEVRPIFRCMNCGLVAYFELTDLVGNKVFPVHKDAHYAQWNKRGMEPYRTWDYDKCLPCPFCGYRSVYPDWFTYAHGFKSKAVYCPNCTCRGPEIYQHHLSEEELNRRAIVAWNSGTK